MECCVDRLSRQGLKSHPGHVIAKVQRAGFGAMLSFELVGDVTDARRFVEAVDIITLAESHGGIETLRGRNQPVQVISSRHQCGKGFR
jgi:cystathionine gamma-synthase